MLLGVQTRAEQIKPPPACENRRIQTSDGHTHMEAERINQIGNQLQDLSARTVELRRYL